MKEPIKKSTYWTDICAYFIETFDENPEMESIELTIDALIAVMKARFQLKYNPEVIAHLLKNGFEVSPGIYVFKRPDFISELKNRAEALVI